MDFEKAYQNFINGNASPEEVEFVRNEMKKASEINDLLASVKDEGATRDAEKEKVKKAIKSYKKRDTVKILVIVSSIILVLALGIGAAIGIPVLSYAKDNVNVSKNEAEAIAISALEDRYSDKAWSYEVIRSERELEVEGRIKKAHYVYVFEIRGGSNLLFEVEVNSMNGLVEIEIDD